jgi:hypothetical protein
LEEEDKFPDYAVYTTDEECDLSSASLDSNHSATGFKKESDTFWSTIDILNFKQPVDVVTKVLEANGYILNLENILACVDSLHFGIHGKEHKKNSNEETPKIKTFGFCISFQLPARKRIGVTLKRFYKEIKNYETELTRLRELAPKSDKSDPKEVSPEKLREEIMKLRQQNDGLKLKLDETAEKLAQAKKQQAYASKALASQNLLPENTRIATVRAIILEDGVIMMKSGRATINVPFPLVHGFPELGDRAIVRTVDGKATGAFFYESKLKPFDSSVATVVFASEGSAKIRDSGRRTWVLKAKNEVETAIIKCFRRGMKVMLFMCEGKIIKYEICQDFNEKIFEDIIQEAITSRQLKDSGVM